MHAPLDFCGRAEPLVDSDPGVGHGDGAKPFELRAQLAGAGLYLFARQLVGPARRTSTEVRKPNAKVQQFLILIRRVEPIRDAGGVQDAPEAVAGMGVVVYIARKPGGE